MLLSVGERISCALVAMAINDLGREAISLTGSQAGIITDTVHGKAKIVEVRARRIQEALDGGPDRARRRLPGHVARHGTSRRSAAAAPTRRRSRSPPRSAPTPARSTPTSRASTRADPRSSRTRASSRRVSYEEMLELAAVGATVLQLRSVEFARNHGVTLHVRSTFSDEPGTWIIEEDDAHGEGDHLGRRPTRSTRRSTASRARIPADLFSALADRHVNVDTIIQTSADVIVFSAPLEDRGATAGRARRPRRLLVGARRSRQGDDRRRRA